MSYRFIFHDTQKMRSFMNSYHKCIKEEKHYVVDELSSKSVRLKAIFYLWAL